MANISTYQSYTLPDEDVHTLIGGWCALPPDFTALVMDPFRLESDFFLRKLWTTSLSPHFGGAL